MIAHRVAFVVALTILGSLSRNVMTSGRHRRAADGARDCDPGLLGVVRDLGRDGQRRAGPRLDRRDEQRRSGLGVGAPVRVRSRRRRAHRSRQRRGRARTTETATAWRNADEDPLPDRPGRRRKALLHVHGRIRRERRRLQAADVGRASLAAGAGAHVAPPGRRAASTHRGCRRRSVRLRARLLQPRPLPVRHAHPAGWRSPRSARPAVT